MKLYYIGLFDSVVTEDGISRPVLPWDGLGVPARWIALGNGAGGYSKQWVFAVVGGEKHPQIQENAKAFVLPDGGLDITWGSLSNSARKRVTDMLESLGVDTSSITTQTSIGQILEMVGKQLQPNFSIIGFDVQDSF